MSGGPGSRFSLQLSRCISRCTIFRCCLDVPQDALQVWQQLVCFQVCQQQLLVCLQVCQQQLLDSLQVQQQQLLVCLQVCQQQLLVCLQVRQQQLLVCLQVCQQQLLVCLQVWACQRKENKRIFHFYTGFTCWIAGAPGSQQKEWQRQPAQCTVIMVGLVWYEPRGEAASCLLLCRGVKLRPRLAPFYPHLAPSASSGEQCKKDGIQILPGISIAWLAIIDQARTVQQLLFHGEAFVF